MSRKSHGKGEVMRIPCPQCGALLNVSSIRRHFVCQSCSSKLKGNTTGPEIAGIVMWILADLVIYPMVYMNLGFGWPAHAVRIGIDGCIVFPLYLMLIRAFVIIELDDRELE